MPQPIHDLLEPCDDANTAPVEPSPQGYLLCFDRRGISTEPLLDQVLQRSPQDLQLQFRQPQPLGELFEKLFHAILDDGTNRFDELFQAAGDIP